MVHRAFDRRRFLGMLGATSSILIAACTTTGPEEVRPEPTEPRAPDRRWPAEWERHEATLMAMPFRPQIYGRRLRAVQREWVDLAQAIGRFEPLHAVVPRPAHAMPASASRVAQMFRLRYDDMWIRDNGPIIVVDETDRVGLDWRFDGWGGAFDGFGQTWADDDRLPERLLPVMGLPREPVDMVLEGGAILSDGEGTIFTTRENLLDAGRNPSLSDHEIEAELHRRLGTSSVVWLPYGLLGDLTAGHVDGVASVLGPGRVLAQTDPAGGEEGERLQANVDALRAATDASGRRIEVVEFPMLPRGSFGGMPASTFTYVNLIFVDGGMIVPTTGEEALDREALGLLREIEPDREVVGLAGPTMNWAGGGFHCVTQPVPAPDL
jgi:agmatine deiminase